jgi:hypothetical protein
MNMDLLQVKDIADIQEHSIGSHLGRLEGGMPTRREAAGPVAAEQPGPGCPLQAQTKWNHQMYVFASVTQAP